MYKYPYYISSFDNIKINYITIPKTGSTSILYTLLKADGKRLKSPNYNSAESWLHSDKIIKFISLDEANTNEYLNFTTVRNPLTRAYSLYNDFMFKRLSLGQGGGSKDFEINFKTIRKSKDFSKLFNLILQYSDEDRGTHFKSQESFCRTNKLITLKIENITDTINLINPNFILTKPLNANKYSFPILHKDLIEEVYPEDFDLWKKAK